MAPKIAQTARGLVEYRLEGTGPTVMVLNGGHCSRDTRPSHERLARQGYSVLTPSRPGYDATPSATGRSAQAAADALAALLDTLRLAAVSVIGISAAGPTALALAQRHPQRVSKLVLESAVTWPWDAATRRGSTLLFGPSEQVTWGLLRWMLRLAPRLVIRPMMRALTTLDVDAVLGRMSADDLEFVKRIFATSRSGTGFSNDLGHTVPDLTGIRVPVLAMYSPHDRAVPPRHAQRIAADVPHSAVVEVPADSHLLWIGPQAPQVWERRLAFLQV
jgi:pimeloyl-ACP methyl ester carboxylesterase